MGLWGSVKMFTCTLRAKIQTDDARLWKARCPVQFKFDSISIPFRFIFDSISIQRHVRKSKMNQKCIQGENLFWDCFFSRAETQQKKFALSVPVCQVRFYCLSLCLPEPFFCPNLEEAADEIPEQAKKKQKVAVGLWKEKHQAMRTKYALGDFTQPWFEKGKRGGGLTCERTRDFVNVAYGVLQKTCPDEAAVMAHTLDVSQCISRRPWSAQLRNLTTSSQLFNMAQDRLLTPHEHFRVLGLERVSLSGLTPHQAKELAGQAMAAPCIAVPLHCVIATLHSLWR